MPREPAPALQRGLLLLRRLAEQGPARVEDLVRRTALPRTSLLRLLEVLRAHGAADRGDDGRWRACMRYVTARPLAAAADWRAILEEVARRFAVRCELWRLDGSGCELLQACDPPGWRHAVYAYPGWRPETRELLAPVLVWWASCASRPPGRSWHWRARRRRWLGPAASARLVDEVRLAGGARCPAVGPEGLRRLAVPIGEPDGRPVGALVAVQPVDDDDAPLPPGLRERLDRAASRRR